MSDARGRDRIELEREFPHAPRTVWSALTEPTYLARWWAEGDIAPKVGHRFTLDMESWGQVPCEVLEVEPEERLVFRFGDNWTLTWTLESTDAGTRLRLQHTGFDPDDPRDRHAFEQMGPGWRDEVLPELAVVLDEDADQEALNRGTPGSRPA